MTRHFGDRHYLALGRCLPLRVAFVFTGVFAFDVAFFVGDAVFFALIFYSPYFFDLTFLGAVLDFGWLLGLASTLSKETAGNVPC
jgi:hypothetical protein